MDEVLTVLDVDCSKPHGEQATYRPATMEEAAYLRDKAAANAARTAAEASTAASNHAALHQAQPDLYGLLKPLLGLPEQN